MIQSAQLFGHYRVVSYVSNTFSFMLCVDKIYDKAFYQERKFGTTIRRVAFISSNLTV